MAEKDKGTNERLTLEITEVSEPKDIGKDRPWMMLEFKAKVLKRPDKSLMADDKPHTFKAYNNTKFFEIIEAGGTIHCDINISHTERGDQVYTNRKVVQIYQDGQPVNVRQSGGGRYQDNPETRASIETQTAVKETMQFSGTVIAAAIKAGEPLQAAVKFIEGLELKLIPAIDWCNAHIPDVNTPQSSPEPRQPASTPKQEEYVTDARTKLLNHVMRTHGYGNKATAINYIVKHYGISKERIDKEPEKVLEEIS
jgi:hypothetical protein